MVFVLTKEGQDVFQLTLSITVTTSKKDLDKFELERAIRCIKRVFWCHIYFQKWSLIHANFLDDQLHDYWLYNNK